MKRLPFPPQDPLYRSLFSIKGVKQRPTLKEHGVAQLKYEDRRLGVRIYFVTTRDGAETTIIRRRIDGEWVNRTFEFTSWA